MLIDFEKAFDSVSWKFLYFCLESFGFDQNFINWIKLFNSDINSYILQCGVLSSQINIKRGCRQGDPLSPYLFLLVVEILSLIIENDTSIKGITIGSQTYKLTQFADDTTILLDGNTSSLGAALNILEVFGSLSGLIVNAEKTKMVWIGSKRFSKDQLNVPAKLKWGNSNFTLLGIEFSTNMQDIPNINYSKAMTSANQVLSSWKYRSLTPFGKITVLKTLVLSKFNHLFASIISPQNFLNELNKMVFRYLWDGKPEKINRKRVCQDYLHGGMRMVDIFNLEKSLKLSWLKQLNIDNKNLGFCSFKNQYTHFKNYILWGQNGV